MCGGIAGTQRGQVGEVLVYLGGGECGKGGRGKGGGGLERDQ